MVIRAGVEQFLHGLKGRFFAATAAVYGKAGIGFIQCQVMRRHQHWQRASHQAEWIAQLSHGKPCGRCDLAVAEGIAQKLMHKGDGAASGVDVAALQIGGKGLPLGAGNLKGAAVFVFVTDAFGQAVVRLGLCLGAALSRFFQLLG